LCGPQTRFKPKMSRVITAIRQSRLYRVLFSGRGTQPRYGTRTVNKP
jgi:hypothetical protein